MNALAPRFRFNKRFAVGAGVLAYIGVCLYATRSMMSDPSIVRVIAAFALPVLPFALLVALRAPLIFPFCLYIAFIPFDNLSEAGAVGSGARLLAITSIGAIVLRALISRDIRKPGAPIVAWGLVMMNIAASVTWAMNQQVALDFTTRYLQLYLLLAIVALMPVEWRDLRAVLIASVIGGVCAAIYGDYLYQNAVGVTTDNRLFVRGGERHIDPNHFAAALIGPLSLALITYLRLRVGPAKIGMLIVVCILGSGFITAGSRGGLIAVGVMLVYFLWRSNYRFQLGLFAAVGTVFVLGTSLTDRFAVALSSGGNGRTSIWRTAFAAFRHAWLFGSGTGNFQDAYDRVWLEVNHGTFRHWHIVAHNLIAQTSVELGALGLTLMLTAWYVQAISLRGTTAPAPYNDIRIAIEGATLGLFCASMFLDLMWYKYSWAVFIFAALARQYSRSLVGERVAQGSATTSAAVRGNTILPKIPQLGEHHAV